ncbi:MAG: hypothetical protein JJT94_01205 [Bernardetiaceae bacterium]|nr:hypothetical protein [Bernardetiaceae bacterium]
MPAKPEILQENHYYPFGMSLVGIEERDLQSVQGAEEYRFLFNGKERETALSLHLYDFHARQQDPQLGRFWGVDALAEERNWLSSYNFVQNNPLLRVDPDGNQDTWYTDGEGNVLMHTEDGSEDIVVVPDDKLEDFKSYAEFYTRSPDVYDSPAWNDYWKSELGLADKQLSSEQISHLSKLNSDWSREKAVSYWLNPTLGGAFEASLAEALSQWTNPELLLTAATISVASTRPLIQVKNRALQGGSRFGIMHYALKDGKILMQKNGKLLPANPLTKGGKPRHLDFVITAEGHFILGKGHYNLSGGAEYVQGAGRVLIKNGKITNITNHSGHYRPSSSQLIKQAEMLDKMGLTAPNRTISRIKYD